MDTDVFGKFDDGMTSRELMSCRGQSIQFIHGCTKHVMPLKSTSTEAIHLSWWPCGTHMVIYHTSSPTIRFRSITLCYSGLFAHDPISLSEAPKGVSVQPYGAGIRLPGTWKRRGSHHVKPEPTRGPGHLLAYHSPRWTRSTKK